MASVWENSKLLQISHKDKKILNDILDIQNSPLSQV
jgi:hypothetical protein